MYDSFVKVICVYVKTKKCILLFTSEIILDGEKYCLLAF